MTMNGLEVAAFAFGGAFLLVHMLALLAPATMKRWIEVFPRSVWPGWILSAVALSWATVMLFNMPMGGLDRYKPIIYVAAPVLFFLVVRFMDELLAPRALGGILLLLPLPLLEAARWHESAWRLVVVISAYVMVIEGMALVLSPYLFRRWMAVWLRSDARFMAGALLGAGFGVSLIVLAVLVY